MIRCAVLLVISFAMTGCGTQMAVVKPAEDGRFPTKVEAKVVSSVPVDLDSKKSLVLVPNGDFTGAMVENIGYFDEVMNFEELQNRIIADELTDKVPSIQDRIGINNAARNYRPFLWVYWESRKVENKAYLQLKLVDAMNMQELFVAETHLDYVWAGVDDQKNRYPIMNALIDYIEANSESFGK